MGLGEFEELQKQYNLLEKLYKETVQARDQAIEERDKATVLLALQLQSESHELNKQIETLQGQNKKLNEDNGDLKIRLRYAKDDLNNLQQKHIRLQIEQEKCLQEKEDALALLKEFKKKREELRGYNLKEERIMTEEMDPAYSDVRDEILSASEKDLELEPRPPVMLKSFRLEDTFDVHDEIGKGKFGVVRKVTERSSQKVYAAKYITPSSRSSGSSREDIMREISIMNQLHHKRLVGLVDAFDTPGNIIMIMEYVTGGELFERVAETDCLTEKEASFYMYQLLQALQHMHSKNIVHLDLKPENIVCVSKGSWDIKVIDFGLAQELVPGARMKALKGTPEFMAPEAVNFDTISLATDMWSVGVIAYILLSGLSPLLGDDDSETLTNVTSGEWDFDDDSFGVISDQAKDFISALLVRNPRKRNSVKQSLQHSWMKGSASANAVKIDTKKLRQFLAKRRWQKSVNALVAVRRLSSLKPFTNAKTRPSVVPSLATVPSEKEENYGGETGDNGTDKHEQSEEERSKDDQLSKHVQENGDSAFEVPKSEETGDEENEIENSIELPVFTLELYDVAVNERDTVTLEVVVSGNSPYEVEWFKNAVDVTESDRISLVMHNEGRFALVIRDCEDDDTGEYCCVAQNEAGRVTCAGWLTVEVESVEEEEGEEESEESEDEDVFELKDFVEIQDGKVQKSYCIEEEVGRGRFGIVKKCIEMKTASRFCAKFIKSRPSQKEEFKREIEVMNALHHPRLIRLYDAFEEPRQIILIMEYARGGDLSDRMDGDSLPEFEAVEILKQVLEGIKFMHGNGFMHLDLKPQNVMFKNEGGSKIKLIDFSLTRKFDPDKETKISFGTAEYVAPEIVNYEPVTPSADMWAIGVVAYMMLSGESPFLSESEEDTFRRITEGRWEFSDVFDYVSKEAKDFITRLLMKEPRKRMTADQCLEHDWIKSPGFTGKRKSKGISESELVLENRPLPISPTEKKRQESRKFDEQDMAQDTQMLESKVKKLLSKLQYAEKENKLLEHKLRDEEERVDVMEDELRMSESSRKELNEKVSKLEAENTNLSQQVKSNTDILKKAEVTEEEKEVLEYKLLEKSKKLETLTHEYESLKEKMDHRDVLEEKILLLERESKEYHEAKNDLEEKHGHLQKEKEELAEMNEKNAMVNKTLEDEIIRLKDDRNMSEAQYNALKEEKKSLVDEFTKRFEILNDQNKFLASEKTNLEKTMEILERENHDLKLRLENAITKEKETKIGLEKEVNEMEEELNVIKKQREESQKNCEDLSSKLRKAYEDLEEARKTVNNDGTQENLLGQIATLQDKVKLLSTDRENLEDDLEDKEAEIDDMKKKIEQLETENTINSSDLVNYKAKVEEANEEIMMLRAKANEKKEEKITKEVEDEEFSSADFANRIEDYESMIENLKKEVSSLQSRLATENQRSKDLEEKTENTEKESFDYANVVEEEFITRNEEQLESEPVISNDSPFIRIHHLMGDEETCGEVQRERNTNGLNGGGNAIAMKNDFKKLQKLSEEQEIKLARERERTRDLEEQIQNFELERRDGMRMYRELEEKCNQLKNELEEQSSSRKVAEERLQHKEREIDTLSKKVESLSRDVQVITEEKDKGDILYDRLAEKHKNLMKEKKILEKEKQECEDLEESMQTRIHELMKMKDEIESMRDNLRTLVHEKETVTEAYTSLQKDLDKVAGERHQLEEQVRDETHRADRLNKERIYLQGRVEEMEKEMKTRELDSSADKATINEYKNETKTLKDKNLNVVKEIELLRKEMEILLQDFEKLNKERKDLDIIKLQKDNVSKKVEMLQNENLRLLQGTVELDQMKENCDRLSDELERMKDEKDSLKSSLQTEKDEAIKLAETLRQEKIKLYQKVDEMDIMKERLERAEEEKTVREDQVNKLNEERELKISKLREDLRCLKKEKQDAIKQVKLLRGENDRLLKMVNESIKIGEDYDKLKFSFKRTSAVMEDAADLRIDNETLRKEIAKLKDESNQFLDKVGRFDNMKEELDELRQEKVVGLEKIRKLLAENEDLLKEIDKMEGIKEVFSGLKNEKEIATKEIEHLKNMNEILLKEKEVSSNDKINLSREKSNLLKENETLRQELEILRNEKVKVKEDSANLSALGPDKNNLLREVERLNDENENLQEFEQLNSRTSHLQKENVEQFERMKEELSALKKEKEKDVNEMENLKQERNSLLDKVEIMQRLKENLSIDLKVKRSLEEKNDSLEIQLEDQALETMKFKKECAALKKKIDILTKDLQELQNEKSREEEQMTIARRTDEEKIDLMIKDHQWVDMEKSSFQAMENSGAKKAGKSKEETRFIKTLKEEIGFLEKEVEDLSEENKELLQTYKGLQKEHGCLKEELRVIEGRLEVASSELESVTSKRDLLEKRKDELEHDLQGTEQELQEVRKDYDPVKQRLEHAEQEIKDLSKENEELNQNYIDMEEKYDRIRKINRELEEDVDIESNNFAEAKSRNEELNKVNANLQQRITKMQQEISKLRGISEVGAGAERAEKNKTTVQSRREQLEAKLIEEDLKSGKFGNESRKPSYQYRAQSVDNLYENQTTISSLKKDLRSSKERVDALEKELQELREKLDLEMKSGVTKVEEIDIKKKENDSLMYELESTRHRLVSNVLNPLEEATVLGSFRVTAADISAGKSKAWTAIKERIATLVREYERLSAENTSLHIECSRIREERPTLTNSESEALMVESNKNRQEMMESTRKSPTAEDIVGKEKELKALHEKIAQDEENPSLIQSKNEELHRQIELLKQKQVGDEQEKLTRRDKKSLSSSMDGRLGQRMGPEFKVRRSHTIEGTSIVEGIKNIEKEPKDRRHEPFESDNTDKGQEIVPLQVETSEAQRRRNEQYGDPTNEEQMQVARELVNKNKRIFELEQEVHALLEKIEELSLGKISTEKQSIDVDDYRLEILRLEGENKSLKELTNDAALVASKKKIESLQAMNNFLKSEKDELVLQIAAKSKKIEILERRVKELTDMKTNEINGSKNGVCGEADDYINELDEELGKTKHKVAELEAELEHAKNSYNSKLRRELDEHEAKWTKRLRKECTDLQSELSEKHSTEKLQWQKKEVELQNIIRQMKIVMNKKLGEAETERRKLTQELMTARRSSLHGSTVSLDSNTDEPPSNPGTSGAENAHNDSGLSDRELRRVAYKLNADEWSQLGTFLGVGDKDLLQLGGLTMGPQEKAFRLLCVWRTRCQMNRSQMISQLAVSLEEINRKDVAQFVLEQFMSGKPRRKLFGW
ncbi:uncharacterized protein [Montipora foliosa]|uniref:uncharacterized protein isoform X2 n=1 Tax=Montipora foliosa TaxID=591990 RepID=UPI0035F11097